MGKHIEVWLDESSDSDEPMWCVSLCEAEGDEIACLHCHSGHSDALAAGLSAADRLGMICYERSEHGTLIAPSH